MDLETKSGEFDVSEFVSNTGNRAGTSVVIHKSVTMLVIVLFFQVCIMDFLFFFCNSLNDKTLFSQYFI